MQGCGPYKNVEFKSIDSFTVTSFKGSLVTLEGQALFHNPNNMSVKLSEANIDVFMDGGKVAKLEPIGKIKIKSNHDFTIPVRATIDLSESDTISGLLSMLSNKSKNLEFKGYIVLKSLLITKKVEINYNLPMKF